MHTLNRLNVLKILKLEDELAIQESKQIWKWDKKKIPSSLNDILTEKFDNLRNRRFVINRKWKKGSISLRLATRANSSIKVIEGIKTKKSLVTKLKKNINATYTYNCINRNCFICGNRANN